MTEFVTVSDRARELLPCPNPWCHRSDSLPPMVYWSSEAYVECTSCGMQGPSVSPVIYNDDGERIGTRDAEACAVTAWNTRPQSTDKEGLIEALEGAEAVQIGPNGRGGMRVVVHFPKPGGEGRLFAILSDALQDHQS
jgi:hypothetical protein